MAIFRGTIKSQKLMKETDITVIMPYDYPAQDQQVPCRVVYLLHGLGGNNACWTRYSNVERYARKYGIAVVMPDGYRSFYSNAKFGRPVYDYITEELPAMINSMFNVSTKREDTFITGQSMGGYGALKCALGRPDLYCAVGSISGVTDFQKRFPIDRSDNTRAPEMRQIFGEEPVLPEDGDLFVLAERVAKLPADQRPKVFTCCGTEDFLYNYNISFKNLMERLPYDFRYMEWSGVHDWVFFDEAIKRVFEFFFEGGK